MLLALNRRRVQTNCLLSLCLVVPAFGQPSVNPNERTRAKNIILFIGDGVDEQQLTIARSYLHGSDGFFSFDRFDHQARVRVQTVRERDGETPVWVADSASTATAIATGTVTSLGRLGTTAKTDRDVPNLVEILQRRDWKIGVVSTASITDATPAAFIAHTRLRFCQGPNDMDGTSEGLPGCPRDTKANGGAGSVAEQIAAKRIDVLLGGGRRYFEQRGEDGEIILEGMRRRGYSLVTSAEELAAFSTGSQRRLLGLFGRGTLPVEWRGEDGRTSDAVAVSDEGTVYPEPFRCVPNRAMGRRPTLEAMTQKAIDVLSAKAGDGRFFLLVESASIDKQAHAMNPCGQIGEVRALDQAVQRALEFAEPRGDTLILVTSDHGHSPQLIPYPSLFETYAPSSNVAMYPAGRVALLEAEAGGVIAISYGTNKLFLEEHTGTDVPAFAVGPGAHRVQGYIDQKDLFAILLDATGAR